MLYICFYSPFHPNIFASCSADGTVKIWHEKLTFVVLYFYYFIRINFDMNHFRECLMRFDLCISLQDIAWSPYTSTMFAIAGSDGKVYIFDIYANKLEPICEQQLVKESRKTCTKLAFNPIHPILLVGDET